MLLSLVTLRTLIPVVGVVTFLASTVLASGAAPWYQCLLPFCWPQSPQYSPMEPPSLASSSDSIKATGSDVDMSDTASLTAQPGGLPSDLIRLLGDHLLSSCRYADLLNVALINHPTYGLMKPRLELAKKAKATGIAIAHVLESDASCKSKIGEIAALLDKLVGTFRDANVKVHVPLSLDGVNDLRYMLVQGVAHQGDAKRIFFPLLKHLHFDALELFNGVMCPFARAAVDGDPGHEKLYIEVVLSMKDLWMAAAKQIPREQYPLDCIVGGQRGASAAMNAKLKTSGSYLSDYVKFV